MKIVRSALLILILYGCAETPDAPASKEILVKKKIQNNKTEAQIAQDEYLKLQKRRNEQ